MKIQLSSALPVVVAMTAALAPSAALAKSAGIIGATEGCGGCHAAAPKTITVSLTGPATLMPLQVGDYMLSFAEKGRLAGGTGLNVGIIGAAPRPALGLVAGEHTQLGAGGVGLTQLTHTEPTVGKWDYSFKLTAPGAGSIGQVFTLQAAGLTSDGSGDNTGDDWNVATKRITIVPEPGTQLLLGAGLVGIALAGRRRVQARKRASS